MMSQTFFFGWQLWEKLSFVLGVAVVLVFCVGWGKLWWMMRRSKKYAVLDEEKRAKIEELRKKGNIVTSRHDGGIPFGVRAIESGIEVDGIWVSRSNTPIPESLRSFRNSACSSTSSIKSSEITKDIPTREGFSSPNPEIDASLDAFRQNRLSLGRIVAGEFIHPPEPETMIWRRTATYKPRRSSQLRYSSYADNQNIENSTSQVAGTTTITSHQHAHYRHSSQKAAIVLDSSSENAADSEHSSGSDSVRSLSDCEGNMESNKFSPPALSEVGNKEGFKGKGHDHQESISPTDSALLLSTGEKFTIPPESPRLPKPSPFATPKVSPTVLPSAPARLTNRLPTTETEALGETQWPLLSMKSDSPEHPLFMPGAIHYNQAHRRINAGFEVFPAGAFDEPNEINASGKPSKPNFEGVASVRTPETNEKRQSKKLQKKAHDSTTAKRTSIFVERL